MFEQGRFLDQPAPGFTVFGETGGGLIKIIAGYHQFHAVRKAVVSTLRASQSAVAEDPAVYNLPSVKDQPPGDHKAGVIWHTQGSGKSLLMAFYAELLVFDPRMANPTLVVLTDRNDLDDQPFATFAMCKDLIRQTPVQAQDREYLRTLLNRASGGVIFTTIQKFSPVGARHASPLLTTRSNVVIIADKAHRSQYGFKAKVAGKTGEIAYGFAKYLRDALPNASFIGFTGTPIEATDVNTPAVFGHYIDIYDISCAVEDGATVPIYYESRLARIELDEDEKPRIDAEIEALLEDEDEPSAERTKQKWSTVEALVGSDKRLALVAADLVQHFEDRVAALNGKAMMVCMSRRICVALYDEIIKLRPDWHSSDDNAGSIKIVMTGAASDPVEWQQHIGNKARRLLIKHALICDNHIKVIFAMKRTTGTYAISTTLGESVQAFVPHPLPPAKPALAPEAYTDLNHQAELALARLSGVSGLVPSVDWLLYSAIRKEALLTSQIEGIQATLTDLFDQEAGFTIRNTDDVEEVTNYLRAFRLVRDNLRAPNGLPISVRLLCEAHRVLLDGVRGAGKQPGELRRSQNWIGGTRPGNAAFVPPPADRVTDLLGDLERFIHDEGGTLPPLVRIALAHAQFETIHPFLDGNGRIGRLLIGALLEHWGLLPEPLMYLSGYLKQHQAEYYRRLSIIRSEGDWEAWVAFFLEGVATAANDAERSIIAIASLIAADRRRLLEAPKAGPASYRLFELLPMMPRFTIERVRQKLETTFPTATAAVKVLEDLSIVTEMTGQKKNRSYSYQPYIELLSR